MICQIIFNIAKEVEEMKVKLRNTLGELKVAAGGSGGEDLNVSSRKKYLLLELNEHVLYDNERLVITGNASTPITNGPTTTTTGGTTSAYLLSSNKTFVLKEHVTSNTLLVAHRLADPIENLSTILDTCQIADQSVYVLEAIKPTYPLLPLHLPRITASNFMNILSLNNENGDPSNLASTTSLVSVAGVTTGTADSLNAADCADTKVVLGPTLEQLADIYHSSRHELIEHLHSLHACRLNGRFYQVSNDILLYHLTMLLIAARTVSDSFADLPVDQLKQSCMGDGDDLDLSEQMLMYVLNRFSTESLMDYDCSVSAAALDNGADGYPKITLSLDLKKVARLLAVHVIRQTDRNMSLEQFMRMWQLKLDELLGGDREDYRADFSDLKGSVIVNDLGMIEYFNSHDLSFDPLERLKVLFGKKKRWPVADLQAYLEPIVIDPKAFLRKYTKSFTADGIQVCSFNKALSYS